MGISTQVLKITHEHKKVRRASVRKVHARRLTVEDLGPSDAPRTAKHHVPAAQVLLPGKQDLKGLMKPEIFACKNCCNGQMV